MRSWGNVGVKDALWASVGRFEAVSVVVLKDVSGHCCAVVSRRFLDKSWMEGTRQ